MHSTMLRLVLALALGVAVALPTHDLSSQAKSTHWTHTPEQRG